MTKRKQSKPVEAKDTMKKIIEEGKRLAKQEIQRSVQLDFFDIIEEDKQQYSNIIHFYDSLPKYVLGKREYINDIFLETEEKEGTFIYRNPITKEKTQINYKLRITPARLNINGVEKEYFAGEREEIMEDVLRKLSCDKVRRGRILDSKAGVALSFYEVRKELKDRGHTFSLEEIKQSVLTLAGSRMAISWTDADGEENSIDGSYFSTAGFIKENRGDQASLYIVFHPIVSDAIDSGRFRPINYEQSMKLRSGIARMIFKKMSRNFVQASLTETYSFKHSTISEEVGMKYYELKGQIRTIENALKSLRKNGVIIGYEIERIKEPAGRKKLLDAIYRLRPSLLFIKDMKYANMKEVENFQQVANLAKENR